jgi:hypothetical protein
MPSKLVATQQIQVNMCLTQPISVREWTQEYVNGKSESTNATKEGQSNRRGWGILRSLELL